MTQPNFICPICQSPLIIGEKTWQCTANNEKSRTHAFDVARQGYINLHPVQQKNTKNPGDSEASIHARQRFLQAGFYQPLRQAIIDMAKNSLLRIPTENITWLDVGCGDGFYTQGFLALNPHYLIALDISKPAVLATVKTLKTKPSSTHTFSLVASASQVPLKDNSINMISSIFSPILPKEFNRLLNEDGMVLIAKPATGHLLQLREGLFNTVFPHDSDKFITELSPFFALMDEQRINYEIEVTVDEMADLLTMTPYAYRAKPEKRQALLQEVANHGRLKITVDFVVYRFEKLKK